MSSADRELIELIRASLAAAADPERAAIQQAYMKSAMPYFGIGSPELKVVLRPLLAAYRPADRGAWESTIRELWDGATHREERYAATALARHRVGPGLAGPRNAGPLPAPDRDRGMVGPRGRGRLPPRGRSAGVAPCRGDAGRQASGRSTATRGYGVRPSSASFGTGPTRTSTSCGLRSRPTSRTRRSGCARPSAGRCASRRRPTRSGSGPRWNGWTAGCRDCPDVRPSSAFNDRRSARR